MNLMKLSKLCNPQKSCPPRGRLDHAGKVLRQAKTEGRSGKLLKP